ncbi:MAG: glycosyltransferase [Ruminococcaceae bacterium]|nr:glycosyltransferase [Oscillospiraceae bacterium]
MRFSIIVPVYNRAISLPKTIQSVIDQSYGDWELILIDDGSSDNSGDVCIMYTEKDDRIHYFYQDNKGVSAARNYGIKNAVGDYILFLDSDDGLEMNALEVLNERITEYHDVDMFVFGIVGSEILRSQPAKYVSKDEIREKYLPAQLYIGAEYEKYFTEPYVWNKCYSGIFMKDNDISFDENHFTWEDGLFTINCLDAANGIVVMQHKLIARNIVTTSHNLSYKFFDNQIENYINDAISYKERFGKEYNFEAAYHCAFNMRVIMTLISKAVAQKGQASMQIIDGIVNNPVVRFWNDKFVPDFGYEKKLKKYINERNSKKIYKMYYIGIIKKTYYKLKEWSNL